jgi:hypothetical protein
MRTTCALSAGPRQLAPERGDVVVIDVDAVAALDADQPSFAIRRPRADKVLGLPPHLVVGPPLTA